MVDGWKWVTLTGVDFVRPKSPKSFGQHVVANLLLAQARLQDHISRQELLSHASREQHSQVCTGTGLSHPFILVQATPQTTAFNRMHPYNPKAHVLAKLVVPSNTIRFLTGSSFPPNAFKTSCPATPPITAALGGNSNAAVRPIRSRSSVGRREGLTETEGRWVREVARRLEGVTGREASWVANKAADGTGGSARSPEHCRVDTSCSDGMVYDTLLWTY